MKSAVHKNISSSSIILFSKITEINIFNENVKLGFIFRIVSSDFDLKICSLKKYLRRCFFLCESLFKKVSYVLNYLESSILE